MSEQDALQGLITNADLMAVFDFTEEDLKTSRLGMITERQLRRLKTHCYD